MYKLTLVLVLVLTFSITACQRASVTPSVSAATPQAATTPAKEAHYCAGITKQGVRCKRRVKNEGDYCFIHKDQDKRQSK